jgi:UDP-N-acetylglucosamine 2-epimerase (non-hydrolysing)
MLGRRHDSRVFGVIHFVVGTRAQLLKLAPVMLECERRGLAWRWIYTAQHQDTIEQTVETFGLEEPDYVVVRWNTEAKSFGRMAWWFGRMLLALPRSRRILDSHTGERSIVVTHGDTFTTWLGALMGRLTRTNVMHVESGLRSFNLRKPFPEELNRLITFRLADYYACPGTEAVANLERYRGFKLDMRANTQADTLRFGLVRADAVDVDFPSEPFVIATIHRYENIFHGDRLARVVAELERVSKRFLVVFIQHPATELQLEKLGLADRLACNHHIQLIPRLEYVPFVALVRKARFVITDGGGNQEELSYLGKPTLILRDETERKEGLGENALLAGLDAAKIRAFVADYASYERDLQLPNFSPSATIVDLLESGGFGRA